MTARQLMAGTVILTACAIAFFLTLSLIVPDGGC